MTEFDYNAIARDLLGDAELPGRVLPDPGNPSAVAEVFIADWDGKRVFWRGDFYAYTGNRWQIENEEDLMASINNELRASVYEKYDEKKDRTRTLPWSPNNTSLANLRTQLRLQATRPSTDEPERGGEFIFLANGRYSISSGVMLPHDPAIFNLHASPVAYDEKATCPEWDAAIHSYFGGNQAAIDRHYLWMAYELSGARDLQKGYILLGQTRSGKSTMMDIGTALVGADQVVPMSLSRFGGEFNLAPLIGKSVCRINDVRDVSKTGPAVEALLGIIGEDGITINRKGVDHWTGVLNVRFTMCSNIEFELDDPSGAVVGRFQFNRTVGSHLGSEDPGLKQRIIDNELPGVLNRVLDYMDRIYKPWPVTEDSKAIAKSMREQATPIMLWMEDCGLVADSEALVPTDEAYESYRAWGAENGMPKVSNVAFGKALRAGIPGVERVYRGPKGAPVRHYKGVGFKEV